MLLDINLILPNFDSMWVGYFLALFVGISLGLMGAGGSILIMPILRYVVGMDPVSATGYSLFVVGFTALVGSFRYVIKSDINLKATLLFGIPSLITIYCTRTFLLPWIPDQLFSIGKISVSKPMVTMVLFGVLMILAAVRMIRAKNTEAYESYDANDFKFFPLILQGLFVGLVAGLLGAGGGFLIIPALVLMAKMPMKKAVGTSLLIIAINSLTGFFGDLQRHVLFNWNFLLVFTLVAILGLLMGLSISSRIDGNRLKKMFGWFILIMGTYIITREILGA